MSDSENSYTIIVNASEERLLKELRSIKYGQATVFMQDGKPIRIEQIKESIVL